VGISSLAGSSGASSPAPTIGGCDVFPASTAAPNARSAADMTAWNQDVSHSPVAKNSDTIIDRLRGKLHPDFGSNTDYGIPFEVVPADQPNVQVDIGPKGYPSESDFGPAPIPDDASIEGGTNSDGDRHVLVVQQGSCGLYEMWRSFKKDNGWQADATAFFDLNSAALNQEGETSSDAAGLPVLPGLVRVDEANSGTINHAFRVTFDVTRRAYIHPATHYAADSCSPRLPAMGLRLRMKRSYFNSHLSSYPEGSQSRAIFVALYHYGFIVADNGSNWYFQGESNSGWNDADINRLKRVPGSAFQVIKSAARAKTGC
jgi:hypothetical protein